MRRVFVVLFDGVELLDFAGPVQAFHEAADYAVVHCGPKADARTAQGALLTALAPLPDVRRGDLVLVPGFAHGAHRPRTAATWVRRAFHEGATVSSVCTGAFLLGDAGLLDGRDCTTHWKRVAELARAFPRARVLDDRLFVVDGRVITSAGIAAGIDLALALIEQDHGPRRAAQVARELVVYLRRSDHQPQASVYLDHRTHLDPGVHAVQDYLCEDPGRRATLSRLARVAGMSERSLTRAFQRLTGLSIHAYRTRLRLERAEALMKNPQLKLEAIAAQCGFSDARQLRRLWTRERGAPPSATRTGATPAPPRRSA